MAFGTDTVEGGNGFAQITYANVGSDLVQMLLLDQIVPGSEPSYQVCKIIYTFHPLGAKIVDGPIVMAQSQEREIAVDEAPEERLIPAFNREWKQIGGVGADVIIANAMRLARVYGISSLACGDRGGDQSKPLAMERLHDLDLYFNVLDPLNTAGSLVLNQNPNAPDFQKPNFVSSGGKAWHPSRTVVMMNEQPIYIEFTSSSFGFVGRSVYQRALFPLKTFVQTMITDDMVTKKIALLIWQAKTPTSAVNNRLLGIFGWKRGQLQSGVTGNVLQIGENEKIESLNFQNLEGAGKFTRENVLKNIATAAGEPAAFLLNETLTAGFGEGTEDAKQIARRIDRMRIEMDPLYRFMDEIVQRRAWSPGFYKGIQKDFPEQYGKVPYETAFTEWRNAFATQWPNLLAEPDSEKAKVADTKFKSVTAMVETLAPLLNAEGKGKLLVWASDQAAEQKDLFTSPLLLTEEDVADDAALAAAVAGDAGKEPAAAPSFSARA